MKQIVLLVFVVCIVLARDISRSSRRKRQANSIFGNQLSPPQFFQFNGLIPVNSSPIEQSRCQALNSGLASPAGCFYVPVVRDTNNVIQNCELRCPGIDIPFQIQPVQLGQLNSIVPDYLLNGQFSVLDNSISETFVGDSFVVFTPTITTTAAPSVTTTTTSASDVTASTTSTTATTPSTTTTRSPQQIIANCIARSPPDPGCTYSGLGTTSGPQTCAQTCARPPPPIAPACDPTAGTRAERCLCVNGAPAKGCTYSTGGMDNPLTCTQDCFPTFPFGRR